MTAVEGLPVSRPSPDSGERGPQLDDLPRICPYLATEDGAWRSANAVRNHRCTAVVPAIPLALEKQRRLCLVAAHEDCATYLAAMSTRPDTRERRAVSTRPIARMAPVILDQARFDLRLPAIRADRGAGQAILVAVLALAFGAILLARPTDDNGLGGSGLPASPNPSVALVTAQPSESAGTGASDVPETPEPTAQPTASATPSSTPLATSTPPPATPVPTPAPTAARTAAPTLSGDTYRVRSGDTLVAIAARFGTTTRVLIRINGIEDPSKLRVGQILKLP